MTNSTSPAAHASSWIEAWNAHDLEAIMEHYAEDVEFQVDTVVSRWGRADGILRGKAELKEHFRRGLEKVPQIKFDLEQKMGKLLYISTTESGSGKALVALGTIELILRKATKVSFFRPVIQTTQTESKSEDLLADRDEGIELILQHFGLPQTYE